MPFVLVGISRAAPHRWACTIMAAVYSGFLLALIWILPLFPAEPKLGPVYYKVTHFVPPAFPLLLIVPAVALDLLRRVSARWGVWRETLATGTLFVATFLAVQWPFAELSAVAAGAQLVLRHALLRLLRASVALEPHLSLLAGGGAGALLDGAGDRHRHRARLRARSASCSATGCGGSSDEAAVRARSPCSSPFRRRPRRTSAAPTSTSKAPPAPIACS